jgi:hypothetical protein
MPSRSASAPSQVTESFLVRRWRSDKESWRYALQRIPDGAWQGFASAADLLAYLSHASTQPGDEAKTAEDDC